MNKENMTPAKDRTAKIESILSSLYADALTEDFVVQDDRYAESLDKLFHTSVWGFREILLVVVVAMELNNDFRPSSALYSCNPRALYEGPIKQFLIEKGIPHRKSGPLNIAKAAPGLNEAWAAQRRPASLAAEVVKIVRMLEANGESNKHLLHSVGVSLMRQFVAQAKEVKEMTVDIDPTSDPVRLAKLCECLIHRTPDAGNTPQIISAYLLKFYHQGWQTGVCVSGDTDGAAVSSTTSNKPGDISEEKLDEVKVYEITVKPFDLPRIIDSHDVVTAYNLANDRTIDEITVICRPDDCPRGMTKSGLKHYLGHYEYRDITYYYWDLFEWVASTLQQMTRRSRRSFYEALNEYINGVNTAESVKRLWKALHDGENGNI